jgi:2-polyprenyl-6-methoxyphenol hydroxylase-like FAD-dependent oxidoreductase
VRLRGRRGLAEHETRLAADLVVDASGRESQAPQWLANLGYTPPRETSIRAFAGYASRLYQRPAEFGRNWKTLYVRPTPPHGTRGGVIIPIEGDRWHVTLLSMAGDYPPTDEAGFLAFARSLPAPQFYEAIKAAEPLTMIYGYRRTESRVRHYDQLPRYLEGFLVCGDAAYSLNPVYAQGMTAAVLGSLALEQCLRAQQRQGDLSGLPKAFQTQLSRVVADPWQMVTREDGRWPATEVVGPQEIASRPVIQQPAKPAKKPAIRPAMAR